MHALLALLQAAAISTSPAPAAPPEQIDLLSLSPKPCPRDGDQQDIIVCAR